MENSTHEDEVEVFARYIVRNGKTIYPRNAKFFHFWVKKWCYQKIKEQRDPFAPSFSMFSMFYILLVRISIKNENMPMEIALGIILFLFILALWYYIVIVQI